VSDRGAGKKELSIVIPGYNESEIIEDNLLAVRAVASELGVSFEILFVNDGSTDDTGRKVSALAAGIGELRVVSYDQNRGRGYALRKGFEEAGGRYIMTLESDMNYGGEIISRLYSAIADSPVDVVVASPYMREGRAVNVPVGRLMLSRWGNKLLSASLGNVVHTVSGMTRIYRADVLKSLPLYIDDKEIHLEIIAKALALGLRVEEIPATLSWPERRRKEKPVQRSSFAARKYIISHMTFALFERPILLFGFAGIIFLTLGVLLGSWITYLWFVEKLSGNRPLITLTAVLLLGGVLVTAFGILGSQINELRKEIYRIQRRLRD
jgi:glycosyltransferase involved in cell wall biosynthesis